MSERKVLNKYYPPDFDPSKIPKMRGPKNRTFSIRIMAPFNMRCNTCGEYIYKGKKFNSRKENVEDEDYLGLRIFRFYIKCPRCVAEIAFKTDLLNTDYTLEAGATRLFEAEKLAQKMAEQERKEKEEEELNPMKVLENRTKQSRNELEQLDTLEELRDLNARQAGLNMEEVISQHQALTAQDRETLARLQEEEDTRMARELLSSKRKQPLPDPDSDEEGLPPRKQQATVEKPTDLLTQTVEEKPKTNGTVPAKTSLQSKSGMAKLIVLKKKPASGSTPSTSSPTSTTDASSKTASSTSDASSKTASSTTDASSKTASSTSDASSKTANSTAASESSSTAPGTAVNGLGTSRTAKTSAAPAAAAGVEQSSAATGSESTPSKSSQPPQQKSGASLGLGLLGSYSDSDASDASE